MMCSTIKEFIVLAVTNVRHAMLSCLLLVAGVSSVVEAKWYEMAAGWDSVLPVPVDMSERVLDAPAGKHGHIKAVDDKLFYKDGTPARFWGVVMAVSNNVRNGGLPPEKRHASVIAKKIASYGFNHVRIVGFDGHAPQAINNWKKTGEIKSIQIDRLDYFIAELRKLGIYYSLSVNNSSPALFQETSAIIPNDGEKMPFKKFRNVRLFDEVATDYMADWIGAFYSRKNPYTEITYAADPANIYAVAVNEDTANIVRFNKGRTLSEEWKGRINLAFNDFLHTKYGTEKEFKASWTEKNVPVTLPGESFRKYNIDLFTRLPHKLLPAARISDIQEYLSSVDMRYLNKVRSVLDEAGYRGLITGTNKWYGLGNLYVNYMRGDYVDGHDYFGGISNVKRDKRKLLSMSLQNKDYLRMMRDDPDAVLDDTRFALSRMLPSHLIDRPYISSEWNHAIWSDFAYQGPFIISSYASLNGVDGLDVHMFYNHPKPSYQDSYPRNVLNVAFNPLHQAIMPTLSLAFLNGYIDEYQQKTVYCYARDKQQLRKIWHMRPKVPDGLKQLFSKKPFGSVRVGLLDGCKESPVRNESSQDYEPVKLVSSNEGESRLKITTEKYVAVVGDLSGGDKNGPVSIDLKYPGSASYISLDEKPLIESECALLTIAGPTKNTGMGAQYRSGKKVIDGVGQPPQLLRANEGSIVIEHAESRKVKVMSVGLDGDIQEVDVRHDENSDMHLLLRDQKTPWYIISSNGCSNEI